MMKNLCRAVLAVALLGAAIWGIGPAVAVAANLYDYWSPNDITTKVWYVDESNQMHDLLLDGGDINRGTIPPARVDGSSITKQGNDFNGNLQLIRTQADGKYPALDGSDILNIAADQMSDGSEAAPFAFEGDPNTGLYSAGADELGIVTGGVARATVTSSGIDATGYTEAGSDTLSNSISGNAGTATALAADPSDCAAGNFANAIAADGDLTCSNDGSSLTGVDADTAGALAADPTDCGDGFYSLGIQADGTAVCSALDDTTSGVNGSTAAATSNALYDHNAAAGSHSAGIAGNAATASALAADPTDCGDGFYSLGIGADGTAVCSAVETGPVSGSTAAVSADGLFDHNADAGAHANGIAGEAGSVAAANVTAGTFGGSFTFSSPLSISGLEIKGADTNANICAMTCTGGGGACWVSSTTDYDVYRSTSSDGWMGLFHGLSPCR